MAGGGGGGSTSSSNGDGGSVVTQARSAPDACQRDGRRKEGWVGDTHPSDRQRWKCSFSSGSRVGAVTALRTGLPITRLAWDSLPTGSTHAPATSSSSSQTGTMRFILPDLGPFVHTAQACPASAQVRCWKSEGWSRPTPGSEGSNNRDKRTVQSAHQDEPPSAWAREQSLRAAAKSPPNTLGRLSLPPRLAIALALGAGQGVLVQAGTRQMHSLSYAAT